MAHAQLKASLSVNTLAYAAGLKQAEQQAKHFAQEVGANLKGFISNPLKQIGAAAVGFLTYETFKAGIEGSIETGAALEKMHKRTGIAIGSLVMLKKTFKDNEVDADNLGAVINKMQRTIESGSKAFEDLGLSIGNLKTQAPDAQFNAIARSIGGLPTPAERTAAAMKIFGRAGGELLPIFENLDSLGTGVLSEKARVFQQSAEAFEKISVSFRQAADNLQSIFVGIASQVTDQLLYIAKILKSPDFLSIGLKVGEYFRQGLNIFIGAVSNLSATWNLIKEGLTFAFLSGLNYLYQGFEIAKDYFKDGFPEMIQGIGQLLEAVLLEAFAVPIAYFQAGIDAVLFKIPESLGGSGEKASAQQQANLYAASEQRFIKSSNESMAKGDIETAQNERRIAIEQGQRKREFQEQAAGRSVADRALDYQKVKPQIYNNGQLVSSDDLRKQSAASLGYGGKKFSDVAAAHPYQDLANAGEHGVKASGIASALSNSGQGQINSSNKAEFIAKRFAAEMDKGWTQGILTDNSRYGNKGGSMLDAKAGREVGLHGGGLGTSGLLGGDSAYHKIRAGDHAREKAEAKKLSDAEKSKKEDKLGQPGVLDQINAALQSGS